MRETLINIVEQMYDSITAGPGTGILTQSLSGFNGVAYDYITLILNNVALPIAYPILARFALLELWKASTHMEGNGGHLGIEIIIRVMVRVILCKLVVDYSLTIMEAIFQAALYLTTQIQTTVAGMDLGSLGGITSDADLSEIEETTGFFSQLALLIELKIYQFAIQIIMLLIYVICLGRFIEIYVFIAIAPIPLATLPSEELGQIGKNFLKSFTAVCIQGALLYLVLTFFPMFAASIPSTISGRFAALVLVLILGFAVLRCQQWARSICNAV